MQASPFWKWVMRITGVLCFVTLMTPPAYYFKYLIIDRGPEAAAADSAGASAAPSQPPVAFHYIELERERAKKAPDPARRVAAIDWLAQLVASPNAQVTHPVECMYAKATLSDVATYDRDSTVRAAANQALVNVAAKGAVIKR